ncbi:MAG: hypothetical protein AB3N14_12630, partial [Flavobacteriaceae bacterium]
MSSKLIRNPNVIRKKFKYLFERINDGSIDSLVSGLDVKWNTSGVSGESQLIETLEDLGFLESDSRHLNRRGLLTLSRLCIDFPSQVGRLDEVGDKYRVGDVIRVGKNSATFVGYHKVFQTKYVLKFVRPGSSEDLVGSLKVVLGGSSPSGLVDPVDIFSINIQDIFGNDLSVDCVVFPFIDGVSLRDFLGQEERPISARFFISFIKQVGQILSYLES